MVRRRRTRYWEKLLFEPLPSVQLREKVVPPGKGEATAPLDGGCTGPRRSELPRMDGKTPLAARKPLGSEGAPNSLRCTRPLGVHTACSPPAGLGSLRLWLVSAGALQRRPRPHKMI